MKELYIGMSVRTMFEFEPTKKKKFEPILVRTNEKVRTKVRTN
jgi:hypothetical protein